MTANDQDSRAAAPPGSKHRMARLQISPYLLRPLRSLDQATRDADEPDDDGKDS